MKWIGFTACQFMAGVAAALLALFTIFLSRFTHFFNALLGKHTYNACPTRTESPWEGEQ